MFRQSDAAGRQHWHNLLDRLCQTRSDDDNIVSKKGFALRINADILDAVKRWSDDELRSVNAQIEYALRDALRRAGRLKQPTTDGLDHSHEEGDDA